MATVYRIEIVTVSALVAHSTEEVKGLFEKFLSEYKDENTGLGFECTEVEVKKLG